MDPFDILLNAELILVAAALRDNSCEKKYQLIFLYKYSYCLKQYSQDVEKAINEFRYARWRIAFFIGLENVLLYITLFRH